MARRFALRLGLAAAVAAWAAPADAAWSGFTAMGATALSGSPACARYAEGAAVCAGVDATGTMQFDIYSAGAWQGWRPRANETPLASDPSCSGPGVADAKATYVICAARTGTGEMAVYAYGDGAFQPQLVLAVPIAAAPSCAPLSAKGRALGVVCVGRTDASQLAGAVFHNGGGWSPTANWYPIALKTGTGPAALPVLSPASCAADNGGNVVCAWQSAANGAATLAAAQLMPSTAVKAGVAWGVIVNLGGMATNPPACTDAGAVGPVGCFVTGIGSGLFGNEFAGGAFSAAGWGGWNEIGGLVQSYSCADYGWRASTTSYACGVVGLINSGFYTNTLARIGEQWTGWVQQGSGSAFTGSPACFALRRQVTPGRVMCVVLQANGATTSIIGP